MSILNALRDFFGDKAISGTVIVAVSGGPDSTALLLAFAEHGSIPFEAAHVNHHLRGEESDADESFVRDLCRRLGVTLHVLDGTLDAAAVRRSGIESAAREVRYERLRGLGRTIATAHQKNDQAETILMRLMTGGGIAALRGIHPVRDDGVIRPLLTVTRAEIDQSLAERGVVARADSSNADPRFLRNRVRAALSLLGPDAVDGLARIADQARDQWRVLEQAIEEADRGVVTPAETRFATLPDDPWLRRAVLQRHIRRLDPHSRDVSAADLERLAHDRSRRASVTASLEIIRNGDGVTLRKRPTSIEPFELPLRPGDSASTPLGRLRIHPARGLARGQRFELPKGAEPDFVVRNRRDGDRFQPLGMTQAKKLKDFLIDRKIAAEIRDQLPLLVWNERIVWIAGIEISEAFKVTAERAGDLYEASLDQEDQDQKSLQPEGDRSTGRPAR